MEILIFGSSVGLLPSIVICSARTADVPEVVCKDFVM